MSLNAGELVARLLAAGDRADPGDPCALYYDAADALKACQRKISRIGGVLVDVLEWADAQDPELRPDWVEKLTAAVEDEC